MLNHPQTMLCCASSKALGPQEDTAKLLLNCRAATGLEESCPRAGPLEHQDLGIWGWDGQAAGKPSLEGGLVNDKHFTCLGNHFLYFLTNF